MEDQNNLRRSLDWCSTYITNYGNLPLSISHIASKPPRKYHPFPVQLSHSCNLALHTEFSPFPSSALSQSHN